MTTSARTCTAGTGRQYRPWSHWSHALLLCRQPGLELQRQLLFEPLHGRMDVAQAGPSTVSSVQELVARAPVGPPPDGLQASRNLGDASAVDEGLRAARTAGDGRSGSMSGIRSSMSRRGALIGRSVEPWVSRPAADPNGDGLLPRAVVRHSRLEVRDGGESERRRICPGRSGTSAVRGGVAEWVRRLIWRWKTSSCLTALRSWLCGAVRRCSQARSCRRTVMHGRGSLHRGRHIVGHNMDWYAIDLDTRVLLDVTCPGGTRFRCSPACRTWRSPG